MTSDTATEANFDVDQIRHGLQTDGIIALRGAFSPEWVNQVREDVDAEMLASMLDWLAEKFQDALVSEDLDPGLIHRRPERRGMRIKEFVEILRDGILAREDD